MRFVKVQQYVVAQLVFLLVMNCGLVPSYKAAKEQANYLRSTASKLEGENLCQTEFGQRLVAQLMSVNHQTCKKQSTNGNEITLWSSLGDMPNFTTFILAYWSTAFH